MHHGVQESQTNHRESPSAGNIYVDRNIRKISLPYYPCYIIRGDPDNVTENQIDHIAISKRFRMSLLDVRNKRGAHIGSDHHLMIANFRKKIETRRNKYNVQKLQMSSVREKFKLELKNRFSVLSTQNEDTDIEESWKAIKNVYIETSEKNWGLENINKRNRSLSRHGKKQKEENWQKKM